MNKIIIAFCEGQHDIAFLSKILFVDDFVKYDKKVKNFLKPLNKAFEIEFSKKIIGDMRLGFQSNSKIPSVALHKNNETLVLFHNLNGDSTSSQRKEILDMYTHMLTDEDDFSKKLDFRFIYFFDADDKGVEHRVEQINKELGFNEIEHGKIKEINSFEWACYIFYKDQNSGDLEDILLNLMKINNEDVFSKSEAFLDENLLPESRQKEYKVQDNTYKPSIKFNKKKSIISIAGQLQFSGMNNSVIISKSDYIKKEKLLKNQHYQTIIKLFELG